MRSLFRISMCLFAMSFAPVFGQTLVGSGYSNSTALRVAPGQIATLFVTGLKTVLSQPVNATTVPLPATLSGISVTLNQTASQPTPVPLLSVQQISVCGNGSATPPASGVTADSLVTAITVQIPFELTLPPTASLVVSENGTVSQAFTVLPLTDNLHVINVCDAFPAPKVTVAGYCVPLVTHADGTLVSIDSPALPGEEIVIYAFGLGQTSPAANTGQASPTPAASLSSNLYLQYDFRDNAAPSLPYFYRYATTPPPSPIFAGLTPGQVGLYQINVTIPSSIPAVDSCGSTCSHVACTMYNTVQSNLTIDIAAGISFDGAAICVQPPQ